MESFDFIPPIPSLLSFLPFLFFLPLKFVMGTARKDAFEKEIEAPFWRALLSFAPPSAFPTPVSTDNASPGSQQPGRSVTPDARQGRDRSGLFLTVSLHCAFKPPPGRARQTLLCPLRSGRGRGRRVPPLYMTSVDAKTFLGNLEEDSSSDNRVEMTTARDARGH